MSASAAKASPIFIDFCYSIAVACLTFCYCNLLWTRFRGRRKFSLKLSRDKLMHISISLRMLLRSLSNRRIKQILQALFHQKSLKDWNMRYLCYKISREVVLESNNECLTMSTESLRSIPNSETFYVQRKKSLLRTDKKVNKKQIIKVRMNRMISSHKQEVRISQSSIL